MERGSRPVTRRLASNDVMLDGNLLGMYVVELSGNDVVSYRPLLEELPFTEWVMTTLKLSTGVDGVVRIVLAEK